MISDTDRQLLSLMEHSLPLVPDPFAAAADALNRDVEEVRRRIRDMRDEGVIREISGIFDAVRLGYRQALVAMEVPAERLDEAGRFAAGHPGVSHCYGRVGQFNLWLTLAVSPNSELGLDKAAAALACHAGARRHMVLPTVRRYKLKVSFAELGSGTQSERAPGESSPGPSPAALPDAEQIRAIRALQIDLPAEPEPFGRPAESTGMSVPQLLEHGREFLRTGWLRRYAAVLHHRAAGAAANLMAAWAVEAAEADEVGRQCAQLPSISHCYLRPTALDWPYNLYTMIHGRTEQDCLDTVAEIAGRTGLARHAELWTTAEYKKQRVSLFSAEEIDWERQYGKM